MKYLVDTSALVRIQRHQCSSLWDEAVERGVVAVCEPALAETMKIAEAKQYARTEDRILRTYPWAGVPDNIWDLVAVIRRELVESSACQGLSVADLVIAATTVRLKLTVLHEDADFETIARFVPQVRERRLSADPS